jgi:hypothetical protein
LGTLIEVLITNRFLRRKALFRVGEGAGAAATTDHSDLTASPLNDDRLARALERLPHYAATIQAALSLKAIERFQLDVGQIHNDISNVGLYGAYEDFQRAAGQDATVSLPAYGRTKSGRKKRHADPIRPGRQRRWRRAGRPSSPGRQRRGGQFAPGERQAARPRPAQGEVALHRRY